MPRSSRQPHDVFIRDGVACGMATRPHLLQRQGRPRHRWRCKTPHLPHACTRCLLSAKHLRRIQTSSFMQHLSIAFILCRASSEMVATACAVVPGTYPCCLTAGRGGAPERSSKGADNSRPLLPAKPKRPSCIKQQPCSAAGVCAAVSTRRCRTSCTPANCADVLKTALLRHVLAWQIIARGSIPSERVGTVRLSSRDQTYLPEVRSMI